MTLFQIFCKLCQSLVWCLTNLSRYCRKSGFLSEFIIVEHVNGIFQIIHLAVIYSKLSMCKRKCSLVRNGVTTRNLIQRLVGRILVISLQGNTFTSGYGIIDEGRSRMNVVKQVKSDLLKRNPADTLLSWKFACLRTSYAVFITVWCAKTA